MTNTGAETKSRNQLLAATTKQVAEELKVPTEAIEIATESNVKRIVRQKKNITEVFKHTLSEVKRRHDLGEIPQFKVGKEENLNDDWLDNFYTEASKRSSEDMRLRFGKILAGQVIGSHSYSLRSLRRLGDMDEEVAKIFQKFCSCLLILRNENYAYHASVMILSVLPPSMGGLAKYGLGFNELEILAEYNLITPSIDSSIGIESYGYHNFLEFQEKSWVWKNISDDAPVEKYTLNGVSLSKLGKELSTIVEITPQKAYFADLQEHLKRKGISMIEHKDKK